MFSLKQSQQQNESSSPAERSDGFAMPSTPASKQPKHDCMLQAWTVVFLFSAAASLSCPLAKRGQVHVYGVMAHSCRQSSRLNYCIAATDRKDTPAPWQRAAPRTGDMNDEVMSDIGPQPPGSPASPKLKAMGSPNAPPPASRPAPAHKDIPPPPLFTAPSDHTEKPASPASKPALAHKDIPAPPAFTAPSHQTVEKAAPPASKPVPPQPEQQPASVEAATRQVWSIHTP